MISIFYNQALNEHSSLLSHQKQLQESLKELPQGKLFCTRNQKRFKWYVTDETGTHYLPKSKRALAEKLAYKKYLSIQLKDIHTELCAIQCYLSHHHPDYEHANHMFCPDSGYAELLSPFFSSAPPDVEQWENAPFKSNQSHPENLIHPTNLGFSVRSKSEAMIAMALHINQIPFRYECALDLNGKEIYPDFTILHPLSGKILYWEHFGLIDTPDYQNNYIMKMRQYLSNEIYPSVNLITTYETDSAPLTFEKLERVLIDFSLKKI